MEAVPLVTIKTRDEVFTVLEEKRHKQVLYHVPLDEGGVFYLTIRRSGIFLRRNGSKGVCLTRDPADFAGARNVLLAAVRALRELERMVEAGA